MKYILLNLGVPIELEIGSEAVELEETSLHCVAPMRERLTCAMLMESKTFCGQFIFVNIVSMYKQFN